MRQLPDGVRGSMEPLGDWSVRGAPRIRESAKMCLADLAAHLATVHAPVKGFPPGHVSPDGVSYAPGTETLPFRVEK